MIEPRSVLAVYFRSVEERSYSVDIPNSVKQAIIGFIGIPTLSLDCPKEELILYDSSLQPLLVNARKVYDINKGRQGWYLRQMLRTAADALDDIALELGVVGHAFCHDKLTSRLAILAGEEGSAELKIFDLRHMSLVKTWKVYFIPVEPQQDHFNIKMALVGECVYVAFVRPNAYCELRFLRLDHNLDTLKALPAWSYAFSSPHPKQGKGPYFWNRRKILELFPVRGQRSIDVCYRDNTSYRVTRVTRINDDAFPSFRSCHMLCHRWTDGLLKWRINGSNLMIIRSGRDSGRHHICDYLLQRKGPDFDTAERHLDVVAACDGCGNIYRCCYRRMSSSGLASLSSRLVMYHPFL